MRRLITALRSYGECSSTVLQGHRLGGPWLHHKRCLRACCSACQPRSMPLPTAAQSFTNQAFTMIMHLQMLWLRPLQGPPLVRSDPCWTSSWPSPTPLHGISRCFERWLCASLQASSCDRLCPAPAALQLHCSCFPCLCPAEPADQPGALLLGQAAWSSRGEVVACGGAAQRQPCQTVISGVPLRCPCGSLQLAGIANHVGVGVHFNTMVPVGDQVW